MLKGIAASQGISIAKVYKLEQPVLNIERKEANKEEELAKLDAAFKKTVSDVEKIKEVASKSLAAEELAIFDAHLLMANDPELRAQIEDMINNEGVNAEYATDQVSSMMVSMFESLEDAYMRERAADIKDVTFRLKCNICGKEIPNLATIDTPVIVVAKDLTPSDTGSLNREFAKGFATEIGGRTSHSAIMARSLEIPAVVGVSGILEEVKDGDTLILDENSKSDTIPTNIVENNTSSLNHEATTSKISQEKLFYLMSRGLNEEKAKELVIMGFIDRFREELPMEYAVELNQLLKNYF